MTERLERLIRATEGQPPSRDFVARLRAQIVAETEGTEPGTDPVGTIDAVPDSVREPIPEQDANAFVLDIEPSADDGNELATRRASLHTRTRRLAAAAAVAAVCIGIAALVSTLGDDDHVLVSQPDTDHGVPLSADNTVIDAGTFRIDTLGTAFTFTVDETTAVPVNANGVVMITDLTSRNTDDRTITLRRTPLLPDPADPTGEVDPSRGWPANDLEGWLEAVGEGVTASDPSVTTLGGLDATFVELEFRCAGADCATAGNPLAEPDLPWFTTGSRYRLWEVDQGGEDPIVVVAAIENDDDAAWFDEAATILATVNFESTEPNPVRRAPAGRTALDVFDGVSLELAEDVVVVEPFDGFARLFPPDIEGDVEFLTRPLDTDGVEVSTTDRLLQLLAAEAVEVTEVDALDVGDLEARTFEVVSGAYPNVVLKARAADLVRAEAGWESPRTGQLWVIEHPERGLLLVSAEAWSGSDAVAPLRSWTEDVLQSLRWQQR